MLASLVRVASKLAAQAPGAVRAAAVAAAAAGDAVLAVNDG